MKANLTPSRKKPSKYFTGIIKRVTPVQNFKLQNRKGVAELCRIGIKTPEGKRILITLNISEMGWSGLLHKSKIYYLRKNSNRIIKTSMSNPERYIGQEVKVKGELHTISEKDLKYKLSPVEEFILILD